VKGDYRIDRNGPFAPMLLAWDGAESNGAWVVETSAVKEGSPQTKLDGTIEIRFEGSLPARPETPPFE
jgi:hypothetical protein